MTHILLFKITDILFIFSLLGVSFDINSINRILNGLKYFYLANNDNDLVDIFSSGF